MSIDELLDEHEQQDERESEPATMKRLYEYLIREPIGKSGPRAAICVDPNATVAQAISLMKQHRIGCVLVEAEHRLVGIFTERDVLFRVVGSDIDVTRTPVSSVMTPEPEALTMEDEIAWVLNLMAVGGFRHVPVVDNAKRPLAVFSVKDIVERLVEFFPSDVLNLPPHPGKDISRTREGA